MELLSLNNITFTYPTADDETGNLRTKSPALPALQNVSFTVREGDFVLLCGESGCGKSTLLRLLKREIAPYGKLSGEISYLGAPIDSLPSERGTEIGFVAQNPEQQIVTDKVWKELAFGLENMGVATSAVRTRTAEICSAFGLEKLFHADTYTLSGGEMQTLNLAAVMVMNPRLLILDEPTSQLDPIAARNFIELIKRANDEWGLTVIIAEHRTDELFHNADSVIIMRDGEIILNGTPQCVAEKAHDSYISAFMPTPVKLYHRVRGKGKLKDNRVPLTVKAAISFLRENHLSCEHTSGETAVPNERLITPKAEHNGSDESVICAKNISFRYDGDTRNILNRLCLTVRKGEICSLVGANGAGKTTLLEVLSGVKKPYSGSLRIFDKDIRKYKGNSLHRECVTMLPQNVREVFVKDTLREDFAQVRLLCELTDKEFAGELSSLAQRFGIAHLMDRHPHDLSGGEQQRAAFVKAMLLKPRILLLDEPTKGLDELAKETLACMLSSLKSDCVTILMVTHDVEFAARVSDFCGLIFDGEVIAYAPAGDFFSGNMYYTTAYERILRGLR